MADHYGVTPDDIAAELPGLFPDGFTVATKPTPDYVTTWISREDARAWASCEWIEEVDPDTDLAAALPGMAKDYIVAAVKWHVLEVVYAGIDPLAYVQIVGQAKKTADAYLQDLRDAQREHAESEQEGLVGGGVILPTTPVPTRFTY